MQSSVTSGIISAVNRDVNSEDGNTYTKLIPLDEDGTINELGRLLGTGEMSKNVIANAIELRNNSKR